MEVQKVQHDNQFLKGRQIVHISMIISIKISGTSEALHDFNVLLMVQLKNDSVHGFGTKWDEVLHSMTNAPNEYILEIFTRNSSITQWT